MVRRRTSARKKRSTAYTGLRAAPARRSGLWVLLVLGVLVVVNLYVFVWDKKTGVGAIRQKAAEATPTPMTVPEHALAPPSPPTQQQHAAPATNTFVEGKVAKSDTLGRLLKKSGLTAGEADEVIRALSGVLDYKKLQAGETYKIERSPDGHVLRFELELAKGHHVRAERTPTGELVGSADPH